MEKSIIAYKNREIDFNKPVKIHKNRHSGLWSIRQKNVVGYTKDLWLTDVTYHVTEYGRKLFEKTGQRSTFAYIKGKIINKPKNITSQGIVSYKPGDHFFMNNRSVVLTSKYLHFGKEVRKFK